MKNKSDSKLIALLAKELLSNRYHLAIEAVLDIALHSGGNLVQSPDITARQNISRRSLEPILQQLTRAGILTGVRGPRGGYRLSRERRKIKLLDIIAAMTIDSDDQSNSRTKLKDEKPTGKNLLNQLVIIPFLHQSAEEMIKKFDATTLDQLCEESLNSGFKPSSPKSGDFTI